MSEPPRDVRMRPATVDDVEALTAIYLLSARHHAGLDPDFYRVPDAEAVASHLRQALAAENASGTVRLVAEADGRVAGSVEVELRSPSAASMLQPGPAAWIWRRGARRQPRDRGRFAPDRGSRGPGRGSTAPRS